MKRTLVLILMLLCSALQKGYCATLSLQEAVEYGITNNPKIQAECAKVGLSNADIKEAGLFINPKIILDGAFAEKSFKGGISQTIELGGKRKKRVNVAKADKEVVLKNIAAEIISFRAEIRNAYIDLYSAREYLKTANMMKDLTEKFTDTARKRELAGQIANLDVLQSEIKELKTKKDLQVAEMLEVTAFNKLNSLLYGKLNSDTDLSKLQEDDFLKITEDIETLKETAFQTNPVIQRIEKNIEKTERLEKLAKASVYPDVTLAVGPNILVEKDEKTTTKVSIFAGIDMELPIFNHGQAGVMRARVQREIYEKELLAEKSNLSLAISNAYAEISKSRKIIDIYEKELLPKAKTVLEKSELSFKEGKSGIIIPLTSQEAYIETQKGYIEAIQYYFKALNELEKATGVQNETL